MGLGSKRRDRASGGIYLEKRYHIYRKTDGAWDAAGASFVKNELAAKKAAEKLLEKERRAVGNYLR